MSILTAPSLKQIAFGASAIHVRLHHVGGLAYLNGWLAYFKLPKLKRCVDLHVSITTMRLNVYV